MKFSVWYAATALRNSSIVIAPSLFLSNFLKRRCLLFSIHFLKSSWGVPFRKVPNLHKRIQACVTVDIKQMMHWTHSETESTPFLLRPSAVLIISSAKSTTPSDASKSAWWGDLGEPGEINPLTLAAAFNLRTIEMSSLHSTCEQ